MDFTNGASPINLSEHEIGAYKKSCKRISANPPIHHTVLSSCDSIHQDSTITDSVLGHQVVVEEGCALDHCILLGAERNGSHNNQTRERKSVAQIGRHSKLSYVILGKNVSIGEDVDIGPHNGTPEERNAVLQSIGLAPYKELADGTIEGDFCIESETGIMVIGRQNNSNPEEPILPDGVKC